MCKTWRRRRQEANAETRSNSALEAVGIGAATTTLTGGGRCPCARHGVQIGGEQQCKSYPGTLTEGTRNRGGKGVDNPSSRRALCEGQKYGSVGVGGGQPPPATRQVTPPRCFLEIPYWRSTLAPFGRSARSPVPGFRHWWCPPTRAEAEPAKAGFADLSPRLQPRGREHAGSYPMIVVFFAAEVPVR